MSGNKRCPSCGAEVLTGTTFCPTCGKDLSPEMPRQEQEQTPSGTAPTTQMPSLSETERSSLTALTGRSGSGVRSSRELVLGGITTVAVLGLVALLLGAGFSYFALHDSGTHTSGSVGGQDSAPQQESLKQRVQPRVGNFMLQQAMDQQEMYSFLGTTEALEMYYVAPDGTGLKHFLMTFPSSTESYRASVILVQGTALSYGWRIVGEDDVRDQEGSPIGTMVLLERGDEEMVEWTSNELRARVIGPKGYALDFYVDSKHQSGVT